MYPYIPNTEEDKLEMLRKIGLNNISELFSDIPEEIKLQSSLSIENSKSELDIKRIMEKLAAKNSNINDNICFLGNGAYDHYIPSIVAHVASKSEFYTSYTPYQAEVSQGTLQYIFEFQTLISELTGMDVANASLYDLGTAIAEASFMASAISKKKKILVSKTVNLSSRKVLKTYGHLQNLEIVEIDFENGTTDIEDLKLKMDKDVAGFIVQSPNAFGIIEDLKLMEELVHSQKKSQFIVSVDPISLGILKKPGDLGADIVVGEGQALGIPLSFGGPYLGFMATTKKNMRKLPGRIVGETVDKDGKRAFVLTLQAREQHIRREKATSNICSNQGLNTLMALVYLLAMGKEGLREVAVQSTKKAHYLFEELKKIGFEPVFDKPFFKEFVIKSKNSPETINNKLLENNIIGGYDISKDYNKMNNAILYAVTEKRTKEEIDKLISLLEGLN